MAYLIHLFYKYLFAGSWSCAGCSAGKQDMVLRLAELTVQEAGRWVSQQESTTEEL